MPVTHLRYLKALKDGLLDPRGSLTNQVPSCAIEQANQCWLPFTKKRFTKFWCPYTLVMVVITNTTVLQRPPFTNTLNIKLCYVCACKLDFVYVNFCVNLISYTGTFTKLKLFKILFYDTFFLSEIFLIYGIISITFCIYIIIKYGST